MAANLPRYHREHEKYYSEAPLTDAIALQRTARILIALAERHKIIGSNWRNACTAQLIARYLRRAVSVLEQVDFTPAAPARRPRRPSPGARLSLFGSRAHQPCRRHVSGKLSPDPPKRAPLARLSPANRADHARQPIIPWPRMASRQTVPAGLGGRFPPVPL